MRPNPDYSEARRLVAADAARQLLEDWLAFSQERGTDFDEWCRLRERQYTWRKHYYYGGGHFDNFD